MVLVDKVIHPRIMCDNVVATPVNIHGNPCAAGISATPSSNDIGTIKLLQAASDELGALRRL
jgi:hypothetical protein